jgi:hypothetical protein
MGLQLLMTHPNNIIDGQRTHCSVKAKNRHKVGIDATQCSLVEHADADEWQRMTPTYLKVRWARSDADSASETSRVIHANRSLQKTNSDMVDRTHSEISELRKCDVM